MDLFGNYKPVELLLSIWNFNMTLKASTTLNSGANFQYLRTLVHGEALNQIGTLSSEVGSATPENLLSISLVLGTYVFPIDVMFKKKSAMRRGIKNPRGLKVRHYASCLIDLNKYLSVLPGTNISDENCVTALNETLLNIMANSWSKQL